MGSEAFTSHGVIAAATGFAGRIELHETVVRIERTGVVAHILELLGFEGATGESIVPIDSISGFNIVEGIFLPSLLILQTAGGPTPTGDVRHDGFLWNSVFMSFHDNRDFMTLLESLETRLSERREAVRMSGPVLTMAPKPDRGLIGSEEP